LSEDGEGVEKQNVNPFPWNPKKLPAKKGGPSCARKATRGEKKYGKEEKGGWRSLGKQSLGGSGRKNQGGSDKNRV